MIVLTERKLRVLRHLRRFKISTAELVRDDVLPDDADKSVTRAELRKLEAAGLARRFKAQVADPLVTSTAPVWTITERGANVLATETGDMSLLLDCLPNTAAWQYFAHWVRITSLAMKIVRAFERQRDVHLCGLWFEYDIVDMGAKDQPGKKFKLYTDSLLLAVDASGQPRKVVWKPDFAFEVEAGGTRRLYGCEYETGSEESPQRAAAKKAPGVVALNQGQKFKEKFPQAESFRAIAFCPGRSWMNAMRRAMASRPGSELWRFAVTDEITADSFLGGEHFYLCESGPVAFHRRAEESGTHSRGGASDGAGAGAVDGEVKP